MAKFFAIILVIIGAVLRLAPHLPNVAPVSALALFGGVYLSRKLSIFIPLGIMIVSDVLLSLPALRQLLPWGVTGAGWHHLVWATWGSFALVGLIGWWVRRRKTVSRILLGSLAGSVLFYLITNWAVWAFGTMYPASWSGLIESYTQALPFFRNSLLGDLGYTALFFGVYEGAAVFVRMKQRGVVAH